MCVNVAVKVMQLLLLLMLVVLERDRCKSSAVWHCVQVESLIRQVAFLSLITAFLCPVLAFYCLRWCVAIHL